MEEENTSEILDYNLEQTPKFWGSCALKSTVNVCANILY